MAKLSFKTFSQYYQENKLKWIEGVLVQRIDRAVQFYCNFIFILHGFDFQIKLESNHDNQAINCSNISVQHQPKRIPGDNYLVKTINFQTHNCTKKITQDSSKGKVKPRPLFP